MDYEVYTVYDARTGRYSAPMIGDNDAAVVRDFVVEGNKPHTRTHDFPEDYVLYKIGIFHEMDGTIQSFQAPERICCLNEYIKKEFE